MAFRNMTTEERQVIRDESHEVYALLSVGDYPGFIPAMIEATWTHSVDAPGATGTIRLHRVVGGESLSPFVEGSSYNSTVPWIAPNRAFALNVCIVPPGVTPGADPYFWRRVFEGKVTGVDPASDGDTITLTCADRIHFLTNHMIEDYTSYAVGGGESLEDVIQDLLDASGETGGGPLYVMNPTSRVLNEFPVGDISYGELMRNLALQIGWDLRHRYGDVLGNPTYDNVSRLWLYEPNRGKVNFLNNPLHVVLPGEFLDIRKVDWNDDDVRNVIEVWYNDPTPRSRVQVSDIDSIGLYGYRFMRIVEDRTSNIDTEAEATVLAEVALSDLKDPLADIEIELPLSWMLDVNDLIRIGSQASLEVEAQVADTDLDFSVAELTHTLTGEGDGWTTVRARQKPVASYHDYMRGEPRKTHIFTVPPSGAEPAPEGSVWFQVDSVDFPAP